MGKEDVEGEGGWGGEVFGSDLRFSRWAWFRRMRRNVYRTLLR
jgi:hypothetical protein